MIITRRNMLKALAVGVGAAAMPSVLTHGLQDKYDEFTFQALENIEKGRLLMVSQKGKSAWLATEKDTREAEFAIIVARHDAVKGEWLSVVTTGMTFAVPKTAEKQDEETEWVYISGTNSGQSYALSEERQLDGPWRRKV